MGTPPAAPPSREILGAPLLLLRALMASWDLRPSFPARPQAAESYLVDLHWPPQPPFCLLQQHCSSAHWLAGTWSLCHGATACPVQC
jgi:hypothetical protein